VDAQDLVGEYPCGRIIGVDAESLSERVGDRVFMAGPHLLPSGLEERAPRQHPAELGAGPAGMVGEPGQHPAPEAGQHRFARLPVGDRVQPDLLHLFGPVEEQVFLGGEVVEHGLWRYACRLGDLDNRCLVKSAFREQA